MRLNQFQQVFHALRDAGLSAYQAEMAVRYADCNDSLSPPDNRNMVADMVLWINMPGPVQDWIDADRRHYRKCLGVPLPPHLEL